MGGFSPFDLFSSPEEDFNNPVRSANDLGLLDNWDKSSPVEQLGQVDQGFDPGEFKSNNILGDLNPSGSVVSGSKEDVYNRYKKLIEEKPQSEGYLQDYLNRRPKEEDFKPSLGQKILAALSGFQQGRRGNIAGAIESGQGILHADYLDELKKYNDEGKYVDDAMRMMDSERNRKIKSTEFEIKQKEVEQNHRNSDAARELQMKNLESERTRVQEDRLRRDQDRDASQKSLNESRRLSNSLGFLNYGLGQDRLEQSKLRDQERADNQKYGKGPGVPSGNEMDRSLREHVISDPLGYGSIFDFPTDANGEKKLNAVPVPKWMITGEKPTHTQLMQYEEYMRKLQSPNTDIDTLGFGSYR